jgi:hypothetical protein
MGRIINSIINEKMKSYKGKKIHYAEFTGKDEQGQDDYLYKGFCQKNGKPHGQGKLFLLLSDNNKALSSKWFQEGLWLNGNFYKGTYDMSPIQKQVGYFFPENVGLDIELHGEGAAYHYGRSVSKYKNDEPIGSVIGTFKEGSLIKGKITNAFKIRYTEYDFIKHIHYEGFSPNKEKDHQMRKGKIFYKNGDIFEGKMIFDAPEGIGKHYVAKTKKKHLGLFKGGNFVKWVTSKK